MWRTKCSMVTEENRYDTVVFHSKLFIGRFISIAIGIIILVCVVLYKHDTFTSEIDIKNMKILIKEQGVRYHFDKISLEMNFRNEYELQINGWCAIPGKPTNLVEMRVLLRDVSTQKIYQLPTTVNTRNDATSVINDGNSYENSGFSVHIMTRKFKEIGIKYEILLLYKVGGEEMVIQTNQYLN